MIRYPGKFEGELYATRGFQPGTAESRFVALVREIYEENDK